MTLEPWMVMAASPVMAYLIGSTPFGVIIARGHGVDLRKCGSGNVGATNVGRVIGRNWGLLCFVLDALKGLAPVLLADWLTAAAPDLSPLGKQIATMGAACGAIAGHVFSFWLGFRGGKGVATSLGVVLGVYPFFTYPGLVALGTWIAVTGVSRYVSLGSIFAAVVFVGAFAAMNYRRIGELWLLGAFATLMAGLIVVRHRGNISRLLAGTENKIGAKKETTAEG